VAVVIFAKSTDWMRDFALEYPDEGASARLPAAARIERVVTIASNAKA
jgi:hypothetical protein